MEVGVSWPPSTRPLPEYLAPHLNGMSDLEKLELYAWVAGLDTSAELFGGEYATKPITGRPLAKELVPKLLLDNLKKSGRYFKGENLVLEVPLLIVVESVIGFTNLPDVDIDAPLLGKLEISLETGTQEKAGAPIADFLFDVLRTKREDKSILGYRASVVPYIKQFMGKDYEPNGRQVAVIETVTPETATLATQIVSPKHVVVFAQDQFSTTYGEGIPRENRLLVSLVDFEAARPTIITYINEVNQ